MQKVVFVYQNNPSSGAYSDFFNLGDWRAFTSILNMQISHWWPSRMCKLADYQTQTRLFIKRCSKFFLQRLDEFWRLESVYVDIGYAN